MRKTYSLAQQAYLKKFAKKVRAFRKEAGFSQETLAHKSYLDRSYMGEIERGEKNVSILTLLKVAKALNSPSSKFLEI